MFRREAYECLHGLHVEFRGGASRCRDGLLGVSVSVLAAWSLNQLEHRIFIPRYRCS